MWASLKFLLCLYIALDTRKEDPVLDAPPSSVESFDAYLSLLFHSRELGMTEALKQLSVKTGDAFPWVDLSRNGDKPPEHLTMYLGRGEWPGISLWVSSLPSVKSLSIVGVDRHATIISNQSRAMNSFTICGDKAWSSLSLKSQNRFASTFPDRRDTWLSLSLRNCTIVQTWRDAPASMSEDARKYFAVRAHQAGVLFELESSDVSGALLSGVLIDRGAIGCVRNCHVSKNSQNGIFLYETEGSVTGCTISENSTAVSIWCPSFGEGDILIQRNELMVGNRDYSGVVVRTRPNPCGLRVRVADNTLAQCWNGIAVFPLLKTDENAPREECARDDGSHACAGCSIQVTGNTIPNPKNDGIYIDAPLSPSINNHTCLIEGNVISSTRHLGILVVQPEDAGSAGVRVASNELIETGESRPPFPGLLDCYEAGRCSRNCTGKRFELQRWYRCEECNFTKDNNLGCCMSCAQICHAGHKGIILHSVGVGAFCDCPDRKEKCAIFEKDPPLKEENDLT